jgi:excisionase family DNA binding protein
MMGTIEDILRATLLPALREAVRDEVRTAMAELKPKVTAGDYLSVADAGQIADVHPDTIRLWMKQGKLERHQAGRELRVRRADLERFLSQGPTSEGPSPDEAAASILNRRRG